MTTVGVDARPPGPLWTGAPPTDDNEPPIIIFADDIFCLFLMSNQHTLNKGPMKKALPLLFFIATVIAQLSAQLSINTSVPACNSPCSGSAWVWPVSNYHFLWDDGDTASTDSHLCTGPHYCIVSDSIGGRVDSLACVIQQPAQFTLYNSYTYNI